MSLLDLVVLAYVTAALGRAGLLVLLAAAHRLRSRPEGEPVPLSVLIPAYQEEAVLDGALDALLRSAHPPVGVWVVDDGSTDRTAAIAAAWEARDPRVHLVRHAHNQGKAAALQTGLGHVPTDWVVILDADTHLEPDALGILARSTAGLDGVAAHVRVGNASGVLPALQAVEYLTNLNLARRAQAVVGALATLPGAAGAWRVSAIQENGGFTDATLTEDTDLTMAMQRRGRRVGYADRAVAWTLAPVSLAALLRQRRRWLHGNLQCMWRHRGAVLGGGPFGLVVLPDFAWSHLGTLVGAPLSLVWLAQTDLTLGTLTGLGSGLLAVDLVLAAAGLALERGRAPWGWLPLQRFVWPFILWAVLGAVAVDAIRGNTPWGRAERVGRVRPL